jgi:hypothetical protein
MKLPPFRLLVFVPAIASIAMLSPACAEAPTAPPVGAHAAFPSKLDCLVFASLADSSRLPALTESVRVGLPRD